MVKLPKLMFSDSAEIRAFRKRHGMNQLEFWEPLGMGSFQKTDNKAR